MSVDIHTPESICNQLKLWLTDMDYRVTVPEAGTYASVAWALEVHERGLDAQGNKVVGLGVLVSQPTGKHDQIIIRGHYALSGSDKTAFVGFPDDRKARILHEIRLKFYGTGVRIGESEDSTSFDCIYITYYEGLTKNQLALAMHQMLDAFRCIFETMRYYIRSHE
ncbi:MAG TPA: DUF2299 family protein [Blastocatellia bacterium]